MVPLTSDSNICISLLEGFLWSLLRLPNQPWDFFGRNDAKAETPVLWPPHAKSWLIGKDSGAGRDWGQEEKGTTEDEMAGWHHWLDGRWVWVNSRSWWWTGRPGVLRFMGSQRVGHDWVTNLIWIHFYSSAMELTCRSSPQPMTNRIWCRDNIVSSLLMWNNSKEFYTFFPECPNGMKF